jgi:3-carboxy-cis,cis-muconate cycloisomerase
MRRSSSPSDHPSGVSGLFQAIEARGPVPDLVSGDAWLSAMLDVEAALARALAEVGVIPQPHAEAISRACDPGRFDSAQLGADAVAAGNPVVPLVRALTQEVTRESGAEAAAWVHLGATSQDVLDSATMVVCRSALDAAAGELRVVSEQAAELTRQHGGALLPGRTLMKQAVPIPFALKTATWVAGLDEARVTIGDTVAELPAELGGAAGSLASLGDRGTEVAAAFARLLGLREPTLPWHTLRLPITRVASAAAGAAGVVAKIAGDLVLMAQDEVGELREVAPGRGGSSTLPHKQNPIAAVAARAAAQRTSGLVATLYAAMAQEHERAAGSWHAEWAPLRELLSATGTAISWLRESLEHLEVNTVRMRANLDRSHGLLLAERVTTALRPGLGGKVAHDRVAAASRRAVNEGVSLLDVLLEDADIRSHLSERELRELLNPANYLGSADQFVERALARHAELKGKPHD